MRTLLGIISICVLESTGLFAELIEFPAGASNSLQIPAGTSIQINGVSTKGDASSYIKFTITNSQISFDLSSTADFYGLYINGPASINVSPVIVTPYNNIPYKLDKFSNWILKDPIGNGQFTQWINPSSYGTINGSNVVVTFNDPEYQTYLNWKNAGNTPLPANAYTGTNISGSGVLIEFARYANQPFRTMYIQSGSTNFLSIPSGKKVICKNVNNYYYSSVISVGPGGSTTSDVEPPGLIAKIRGYYIPTQEIDGPEELAISYNNTTTLGAGGSAGTITGFQQGPLFGIFTYYYADESSAPVSDSYVTDLANKITSTAGNYGLVTKNELSTALVQSKSDGINNVLSNPNLWTLYTVDQIQNMAMGNLILNKNINGNFTLNYDIEQSADLQTWTPYQALSLPLSGLPTNKAFVRIKMKNSQSTSNAPVTSNPNPPLATPF